MELNRLLIALVVFASVAGLFATLRRRGFRAPGWLLVHLASLGAVGVGLAAAPRLAGWFGFAVWGPLVLGPALAVGAMNRHLAQGRFRAARRMADLAYRLHPSGEWREVPALLQAFELERDGREEEARRLLRTLADGATGTARHAFLHLMQLDGRWGDLLEWLERHSDRDVLLRDPDVAAMRVRALGELGAVEEMVDAYRALAEALGEQDASPQRLGATRVAVAALAGRVAVVRRLLRRPASPVPPEAGALWMATALQAAGRAEEARGILEQLLEASDPRVQRRAEQRLRRPAEPADPEELAPSMRAALDRLDVADRELADLGTIARPPPGPPARVTRALIGATVVAFLLEIPGGTTDPRNLYELGALVAPVEELQGEWWRLATSIVLHYGAAHLLVNMGALWFFGRYLERIIGHVRYLLLYLACAPASMAATLLWATPAPGTRQLILGASGGVMALLGAILVVLGLRWHYGRSRPARKEAVVLLVILGVQAGYDLLVPEVSFLAHASGALLGIVVGGPLAYGPVRRATRGAVRAAG